MKPYSLAKLLHAFFHEWMGQQRNLSRHTVLSYRDTWKLLLRFVSERKRREITALSLSDLEAAQVLAFLQHLENDRKVSIGTRNCRLAAIHSFFAFVARREPLMIAQCGEIARIPVKKMTRPTMLLSGRRGNHSDSAAARPVESRRTAGSCFTRIPLQHGSPHPGSAECVSSRNSVRVTCPRGALWKGQEKPSLSLVA